MEGGWGEEKRGGERRWRRESRSAEKGWEERRNERGEDKMGKAKRRRGEDGRAER